jgi:hypothetical protein
MMLSPAGRVLTFGFMVAAMVVAAGANGYAHTHRATTTKGTAKVTQSAPEPSVKLRYYGGPKSPMYP